MPFVDKETRILNNALKAQENEKKREERKKMRASRKAMREALQMASGTKERREIKAQFDGAYKTPPPPSSAEDVTGYTSSVTSRSDDGTDSGGGVLGSDTLVVDYIDSDNTAQQATFVIVP